MPGPSPRSRKFCFTRNNPTETLEELADACAAAGAKYILIGKERAPGTGTLHYQGFLYWPNPRSFRATIELLAGSHVEIARGSFKQNSDYCKKEGDFIERGDLPLDPVEKGDRERDRWNTAWDLAKAGSIEEIAVDIRIRYYCTLRRIAADFMRAIPDLGGVCGIWVHGESGSGKTRTVKVQFPSAFPKPRNIWWDGYTGQETVLLDDVDKYNVSLGGHLKHWADFAAFIGEKKGGSIIIRPKLFIVTSQYTIEQIWDDPETRVALGRRFTVLEKLKDIDLEIPPLNGVLGLPILPEYIE